MAETKLDKVVIRFSGDSGDGMQLVGNIFTNVSAGMGNGVSTFPDYPAEIRAPQGSLSGVSGYQVSIGAGVHTPGDKCDVLIAMNAAALKQNVRHLKRGGVTLIDIDSFKEADLKKALYQTDDPLAEMGLKDERVLCMPVTTLTREALADTGMDQKAMLKCRNIFVLGVLCYLFDRPKERVLDYLKAKFAKKPAVYEANAKVLEAGYNYAANTHASLPVIKVETETQRPGTYTDITGNTATAWGLIAASEKSGRPLFLGSYPITPATDILHELAKRKDLGVKAVQMEDEIAGVCSAIGASFAGDLAVTSTSGPGLALKSEGIGLAVMAELPLVIIDVMRGGPSTGLPTKTEQTDLLQALYGRNGESPVCVVAAASPTDCFNMAFEAARIAMEHTTPVILLTDAFIGNGSSAWRIPEDSDLPEIHPATPHNGESPYSRDEITLARYWSYPTDENSQTHRLGGLEKDYTTGAISIDPDNHERMIRVRRGKVERIANDIPELEVVGPADAETVIVGWGGTYGHIRSAAEELNANGEKVAFAHLRYINPMPRNTRELLGRYKNVVVAELNSGQLATHLRASYPELNILQINKLKAMPFLVSEIVDAYKNLKLS